MSSKRSLILNAALDVITDKGIDAASTMAIAKQAGIAKATFFHHFPTRADLIDELYSTIKAEFPFFYFEEQNSSMAGIEKFWFDSMIWAKDNPKKLRFIDLYYNSPSIDDTRRVMVKHKSIAPFMARIAKGQERNEFIRQDTDLLLEVLFAVYISSARAITQDNFDTVVPESLKIVFRILGVPPVQ